MMKKLIVLGFMLVTQSLIVSSARALENTDLALLIYEDILPANSFLQIQQEVQQQISLGIVVSFDYVTDRTYRRVRCAEYKDVSHFEIAAFKYNLMAAEAGRPDAVEAVRTCRVGAY